MAKISYLMFPVKWDIDRISGEKTQKEKDNISDRFKAAF